MTMKTACGLVLSLCLLTLAPLCLAQTPVVTEATSEATPGPRSEDRGSGNKNNLVQAETRVLPLVVSEAKEGRLKLEMASLDQRAFELTLKNPIDGKSRRIKIPGNIPFYKNGDLLMAAISPNQEMTLRPGEETRLRLTFALAPAASRYFPKSAYEGVLAVEDVDKKSSDQPSGEAAKKSPLWKSPDSEKQWLENFIVVIVNPFILRGGIGCLFALVILGILGSLLVNKWLPLSATKAKNRQRIAELEDKAQPLTVYEHALREKIAIEIIHAKTLNDNTKFLTPSAQDRFGSIDKILDKIEECLKVRENISQCYMKIETREFISYSEEKAIRDLLKEADDYLFTGNRDMAERKLMDAEALLAREFDKKDLESLHEKLREKIKNHTKKLENSPAPKYIEHLLGEGKDLLSEMEKIEVTRENKEARQKIKELELVYRKIEIFSSYHQHREIAEQPLKDKYNANYEKIMAYLHTDQYKDLGEAQDLCLSLEKYGLDEKDFEDALTQEGFHILAYPPDPQVNRNVEFELKFEKDTFNQSPLKTHFRYIWYFGDQTKKAEGLRVVHWYKRRGWFILLRKWAWRNWLIFRSMIGRRGKNKNIFGEYTLTLEVLSSAGRPIKNHMERCTVLEPLEKDYSSGNTLLDAFGYAISLLVSCAIALSTYNGAEHFKTFQDILTPFLLGFGLDISKEKIMTASKEVPSTMKAKGTSTEATKN